MSELDLTEKFAGIPTAPLFDVPAPERGQLALDLTTTPEETR